MKPSLRFSDIRERVLVCALFLFPALFILFPTGAGATPPAPDARCHDLVTLPGPANGSGAIAALGSTLPAVAACNGMTPSELTRQLREDGTLWVDRKGRAFYIDTRLDAAEDPSNDLFESAPYPLAETFSLESKPGSPRVIYLDFDGHTTSGTAWNADYGDPIISPPYSTGDGSDAFSDEELTNIQLIWRQVAEDFAPFDVNVTTRDPGPDAITRSGSSDNFYGTRVVITSDTFANCGCGGFAYLSSFNEVGDRYKPAFVFNSTVVGAGEAITHEVGHNLSLRHDGLTGGSAYYDGHGSGATGWAPIMGIGYSRALVQWSAGEYAGATNQEDDLARIQLYGAPLRADDHGDTLASASDLGIVSNGVAASVSGRGIIGTREDVDLFRFVAGAGSYSLSVSPVARDSNLDILLRLRDNSGQVIDTDNPVDSLPASLSGTLAAGEYYLEVDGVAKGDAGGTGYSDYGSLGHFMITGSFADPGGLQPPLAVASASYAPGNTPLSVSFSGDQSSDAVDWDWDFGDGEGSTGSTAVHSYTTPGSFTATLTVTSADGLTDSDTTVIEVLNRVPVASIEVGAVADTAPVVVSFSGSGSADEDSSHTSLHGIESYSWDFGDGSASSARDPAHEYLQAGTYTVTLAVTDTLGASDRASALVEVAAPPYATYVAGAESTTAGSVSGDFRLTHVADGALQVITERESGGKPSSRYSYLEHRWYFTIPAGETTSVYFTGYQDSSQDGDRMLLSYQLNGGQETQLPIDAALGSGTQSASLPSSGGELTLILRDSNRSRGSRDLDSVYIDQLLVQVSNSGSGTSPPASPDSLATAASPGSTEVALRWSDNSADELGFYLYRDGIRIATLNADTTSYVDLGLSPGATYRYAASAFNAAGESAPSGAIDVTTAAVDGIQLSGASGKQKGSVVVDLSWTGIDTGELFVNGVSIGLVTGGNYRDELGKRPSGIFMYQLCTTDSSSCSNPLEFGF